MLEVSGLSVSYGPVAALSDVSFAAEEGSITAVLGANGAGKTTLLRTLTGLVPAAKGTASWAGEELIGHKTEDIARLGIAHVPEGRGVVTELTVEENLRLGALLLRRSEQKEAIERTYEIFPPLRERRNRPAATLSGGERQMLVIGRALVTKPRLLLLDEPSLGLAPLVTLELMRVVKELTKKEGLTLLLVEQNAKSALSIADTAVVLAIGRVVMSGNPQTLASDDQLRHSYLGF